MERLTEIESHRLLKKYNISFPKSKLVQSVTDAVAFAEKIEYPVVLKVMSSDILHKTEAGAIATHVWSLPDLQYKYAEILSSAKKYNPDAKIDGVLVEKQAFGVELIVGSSIDSLFGHTLMLGSGGVFAEVLRDTSFRVIPVVENDVISMVRDLKALPLLKGFRGSDPVNFKALVKTLLSVSKMVEKEDISELDINPLIVNEQGAIAADARIVFS